jgi:hypothetical protein
MANRLRCWAQARRLLRDMQFHGFVSADRADYYAEFILYKINRLAAAGLWDDCLIAIQACEDEFHQERFAYKFGERKAA